MPESKSGALTNLATPLRVVERVVFKRGANVTGGFLKSLALDAFFLGKSGQRVFVQAGADPATVVVRTGGQNRFSD